ncbi:MAG: hypothetical protein ACLSWI_04230, partial [Candidatus Gastranaerophilaceae bacterium]
MSVQKPGISYSSQRLAKSSGQKVVLSDSKSGSTTKVSSGVKTAASTRIASSSRSEVFTRVGTRSDSSRIGAASFQFANRNNIMALYSNKFDYSGLRASLNSNTGFSNVTNQGYVYSAVPQFTVGNNNNSMNKYAVAMMGLQMLQKGIGELGGLNIKGTGSTSTTKGTTSTTSAQGGNSSSGLDAMKGAKDSTSLRSAIE